MDKTFFWFRYLLDSCFEIVRFDYFVNIIYNTCLDDEEHAQQWADKTREKIMSLTFDLK